MSCDNEPSEPREPQEVVQEPQEVVQEPQEVVQEPQKSRQALMGLLQNPSKLEEKL